MIAATRQDPTKRLGLPEHRASKFVFPYRYENSCNTSVCSSFCNIFAIIHRLYKIQIRKIQSNKLFCLALNRLFVYVSCYSRVFINFSTHVAYSSIALSFAFLQVICMLRCFTHLNIFLLQNVLQFAQVNNTLIFHIYLEVGCGILPGESVKIS